MLREVCKDESIMSHAHYSSLLHSSLASPLETSTEGSLYIDEMEELKRKRQLLSDAIIEISDGRVSPIKSTSRSPWPELGECQQGYYVRKAREVIETTLQCLAPGSEADLWFSTVESMPFGQSKPNDATERLVQAYKLADNRHTRLQILSLFVNIFSKSQLQEILPGISKRQIDEARKHTDLRGPGKLPSPPEIRRMRLEATKTDHFLDFISSSSLLQDVSYGTKSLKLDSGEKLLVPAAIRTVIPSRIIKQYQSFCESVEFKPYSDRTLFRILDACSASKQVTLQGLDYIATEGVEAFDKLKSNVTLLQDSGVDVIWANEITQDLKACKRYLKTDYKTHISSEERCKDHCTIFSLSDPNNTEHSKSCDHEHDLSCHECARLACVCDAIAIKIDDKNNCLTEEQRVRARYDYKQATKSIYLWKAHLLRTVTQEKAKQDILANLDKGSTLMIMDWAMKFQPMKFRERMDDFFGKRGRSWHVTCAIKREEDDRLEVDTFVHLFDTCVQDWFSYRTHPFSGQDRKSTTHQSLLTL
ncbi:uncharacterized protein [Acropora muricata]|uniref:uncharacterized protein isoform X1 n=1 Tax=Acropora muricata TaxID=159855 RepID=UPI0034E4A88A